MTTVVGEESRTVPQGDSSKQALERLEATLSAIGFARGNSERAALIVQAKQEVDGMQLLTVEHGVAWNRLSSADRYFQSGLVEAAQYELGLMNDWLLRHMAKESVGESFRRGRSRKKSPMMPCRRSIRARPLVGAIRTAVTAAALAAAASVVASESPDLRNLLGLVRPPWPLHA